MDYNECNEDEVDTKHATAIPRSVSDKMYNSIVRINMNNSQGTGFFMKATIRGIRYKYLLTNYHVIKQEDVDSKKEFTFYYGEKDNETMKIIQLDKNKRFIKCFNKPKDVTLIQIIESDEIPENKYLYPDLNYKNNFNDYLKENFCLAGYPSSDIFKNESHISSGKISKIVNFEFEHTLDTRGGSSGSPICLLHNQNIIGIHKSGNPYTHFNQGTFIGKILDILEEQDSYDISSLKLIKTINNNCYIKSLIILNDGRPCIYDIQQNVKIF